MRSSGLVKVIVHEDNGTSYSCSISELAQASDTRRTGQGHLSQPRGESDNTVICTKVRQLTPNTKPNCRGKTVFLRLTATKNDEAQNTILAITGLWKPWRTGHTVLTRTKTGGNAVPVA